MHTSDATPVRRRTWLPVLVMTILGAILVDSLGDAPQRANQRSGSARVAARVVEAQAARELGEEVAGLRRDLIMHLMTLLTPRSAPDSCLGRVEGEREVGEGTVRVDVDASQPGEPVILQLEWTSN